MKYFISILMLLLLGISSMAVDTIYAHPGNSSWDGCHYCKTNCAKWGHTYGTRHCNNGGVPQFGVADPLYYTTKWESGQDKCDRKYPGTTYNYNGDMCKCSNGNEWSRNYGCLNTQNFKLYNSTESESGQKKCDRNYPDTTYYAKEDKCKCSNGIQWTSRYGCIDTKILFPTPCMYNDLTSARINDVSGDGYICTKNGWEKR